MKKKVSGGTILVVCCLLLVLIAIAASLIHYYKVISDLRAEYGILTVQISEASAIRRELQCELSEKKRLAAEIVSKPAVPDPAVNPDPAPDPEPIQQPEPTPEPAKVLSEEEKILMRADDYEVVDALRVFFARYMDWTDEQSYNVKAYEFATVVGDSKLVTALFPIFQDKDPQHNNAFDMRNLQLENLQVCAISYDDSGWTYAVLLSVSGFDPWDILTVSSVFITVHVDSDFHFTQWSGDFLREIV